MNQVKSDLVESILNGSGIGPSQGFDSDAEKYSRSSTRRLIERIGHSERLRAFDAETKLLEREKSRLSFPVSTDFQAGYVEPSGPCTHVRWWLKKHGEYIDYTRRDFRTLQQILDADDRRKQWRLKNVSN